MLHVRTAGIATVAEGRPVASATSPVQGIGRAPRLGDVTIGAFAPEAVPGADMSIGALDDDQTYGRYRDAVASLYGAPLADMNYLGVGVPGWQARYDALKDWLVRAGRYGDPTIAIEPNGPDGYACFCDGPEMQALRSVFADVGRQGITVWVRFASESNLRFSPYTVYDDPVKIAQYRHAARWFRAYMPRNTRLVFSPLINTVYLQDPRQINTIEQMYQPGAYDRIGGTIYATSWLQPRIAFDWYYRFMRRRDARTPFQICELGGTYARSNEVKAFLIRVARGDWPGVQRVNLFAGDLNSIATTQHGHFGFVLPGQSASYVKDLFDDGNGGTAFARLRGDVQVARLEELSAGWKSPDMTLAGAVRRIYRGQAKFDMTVSTVSDELGDQRRLVPPRPKQVVISTDCAGANFLASAHEGTEIQVTGWDSGSGTPLRATSVAAAE
jgi:hypothetical protein